MQPLVLLKGINCCFRQILMYGRANSSEFQVQIPVRSLGRAVYLTSHLARVQRTVISLALVTHIQLWSTKIRFSNGPQMGRKRWDRTLFVLVSIFFVNIRIILKSDRPYLRSPEALRLQTVARHP